MALAKLSRPLQWALLIALSAVLATVLEFLAIPAALLIGPMIAAIVLATNGGSIRLPKPPYYVAQSVVGTLIASGITATTVQTVAEDWFLFASLIIGMLVASGGLGVVLMRFRVLPGSTALWGCWPGAASVMVLMAEAYGADARLVAFMQYLRVVMVAVAASVIGRLWIGAGTVAPMPDVVWFPPLDPSGLAQTAALAALGFAAGLSGRIPAGAFIVPLLTGAVLNVFGLVSISLPPWLLALCFAGIGWNVGLGFTRDILTHAWRVLPILLGSILALIAVCGGFAFLLHRYAGMDPLTAYLATSPGGADSVAIIAASSTVDMPFVVAMQTLRFFMVLMLGPQLARFFARHRGKSNETPPAPMD